MTPPEQQHPVVKRNGTRRRILEKGKTFISRVRRAGDDEHKEFRKGFRKFMVMLVMFVLFLLVLYFEKYPPRYYGSFSALLDTFQITEAEEKVRNSETFWNWFTNVHKTIAGRTFYSADKLCYAEQIQEITIDGVVYESADPRPNFESCSAKVEFISGKDEPVKLAGNHHLLTFGLFTKRSPYKTVNADLYNDAPTMTRPTGSDIYVRGNTEANLDPSRDEKILRFCETLQGEVCILQDGYRGYIGSTLNWEGRDLQGVQAFAPNSTAMVYSSLIRTLREMRPCYSYSIDASGEYSLVPGTTTSSGSLDGYELSNCRFTWVTGATDILGECQELKRTQPSPSLAYGAALFGYHNVYSFITDILYCDHILDKSYSEISGFFIEATYPLEKHLASEDAYGTFIPTQAPTVWLGYGTAIMELLKRHSYIDANTGVLLIYAVARNLSPDSLFYTFIQITYTQSNSGQVVPDVQIDFFPIVHYTYSLDGYPWQEKRVFILESLLALGYLVALYHFLVGVYFKLKKTFIIYNSPLTNKECVEEDKDDVGGMQHRWSPVKRRMKKEVAMVELAPPLSMPVSIDTDGANESNNSRFHRTISSDKKKMIDAPSELLGDANSDAENEKSDTSNDSESGYYDTIEPTELYIRNLARTKSMIKSPSSQSVSNPTGGQGLDQASPGLVSSRPISELFMDFLTLLALGGCIYTRIIYIQILRDIHNFISDLSSDSYDDHLEQITDDFTRLSAHQQIQQLIVIVTVIMFMYQFFVYTSFHPRVAIIMDTICSAGYHLLPLLAVFIFIVVVYAIVGTQLYGAKISTWESLRTGVAELFLFILGEFDSFGAMDTYYPIETTLFFWSFITIGFFLMFNMVLAVILSVYEQKQHNQIELRNKHKMKVH